MKQVARFNPATYAAGFSSIKMRDLKTYVLSYKTGKLNLGEDKD
ncbi:MAG: hypothetical protein Q7T24_05780 [Deltaproteobacteria bacterium]|nr:hypothetical protein [Deltaproteobacteria bacterium]